MNRVKDDKEMLSWTAEAPQYGLLMTVLSIIFISDGAVEEGTRDSCPAHSLYLFLILSLSLSIYLHDLQILPFPVFFFHPFLRVLATTTVLTGR